MLSRQPIKVLALLCCALFITINLFAQTSPPPYVPNVLPPSPNAAVLMKFADVPVSPYTGTADVSVPVYTIQAKGLSMPISLNYHTGGIRLNEESGWTGLGWALNAGGMISRTVRDKDDFYSGYFGSAELPLIPGDLADNQPANGNGDPKHPEMPMLNINKYIFDFNCSYLVYLTNGTVMDYSHVFSTATSGTSPSDMEPDSYSFNFLGMSGKFIIRPDKTVVLEKQDNIRIQLTAANTFIVTDEKGVRYFFNDKEYGGSSSSPDQLSTWHLSKIITQENDVITFNYASNGAVTVAEQPMLSYSFGCGNQGLYPAPVTATTYTNSVLQSIDFTNGRIVFDFDNIRPDLSGGSKLNDIKVYSKSKAGLKMIKENDLYYSYFNANAANKPEMSRLRLDSVKEVNGSLSVKPYRFIYNEDGSSLAGKHNYGVDHWGFFNGATGNTTLIPTTSTSYEASGSAGLQVNFTGADRSPSSQYMQLFSLQQVVYPTGGKTVFEYSANEYDYDKSIIGVTEYPQLDQVTIDTVFVISTYGAKNGTFDLSHIVAGTDATVNVAFVSKINSGWPPADRATYGKLYFSVNGSVVDLSSSNLSCGGPACSTSVTLHAPTQSSTIYTWNSYVDPSIPTTDFSLIHVQVTYQGYKLRVHQSNGIHKEIAGGIRINSITDYSDNVTITKKRIWDYGYTSGSDQYTYGRLMSFPSYIHKEFVANTINQGVCPSVVILGTSNTGLTSVIQGNIVGYSQVNERTIDPVTNADIGKSVYNFFNSPDSVINYNGFRRPGTLNIGNHLNGSLLSKKEYRNTGGNYYKVHETYNYYHTANRNVYFNPKYFLAWPIGSGGTGIGDCNGNAGVPVEMIALFYPLLKSERVLQDSVREITYDQNDTTKFVTVSNKSFYDNPLHYQLTRSSMTDEKGDRHVSRTTYPQDYITGGGVTGNTVLDTLIRRNMVATTIEKRDSLYYKGSSTGYVAGASVSRFRQLSSGTVVSDKMYKLDVIKPVTDFVPMSVSGNTINQDSRYRQLINFDAYDDKNNIAQYTATGQLPISIIWDYRQMSPVAQVKNADTLSVAYTSFETEGTGHWAVASTQRDSVTAAFSGYKSYNLSNGGITKGNLTAANTYVISYWTRNGSALTIAGTVAGYPLKGGTINGWTYYEHQVTGQTTVTISGTGNIDELRLYPKGAQMTTYTYTPLIGVTGSIDPKNNASYYEYDGLGRLQNIKDQYGNIVKHTDYHYQGQ